MSHIAYTEEGVVIRILLLGLVAQELYVYFDFGDLTLFSRFYVCLVSIIALVALKCVVVLCIAMITYRSHPNDTMEKEEEEEEEEFLSYRYQ